MNLRFNFFFVFILLFGVLFSPPPLFSQDDLWKRIDDGLFLGEFNPQKITLIKIDPKYYSFKLLCASEKGNSRMTAKKCCQNHNLISAINAGMYQADGIKNVGYMKNFNHMNNPRLNTRYKALLAFNPVEATLPEIQIIDMKCQDFKNSRAVIKRLFKA